MRRIANGLIGLFAMVSLGLAPAQAQVRPIDPNTAIDADLAPVPQESATGGGSAPPASPAQGTGPAQDMGVDSDIYNEQPAGQSAVAGETPPAATAQPAADPAVYQKDDLIGAAEGVFGKGAEGLAGLIEKILSEQGEPNAYVAGREASGAFVVGLRYGSGTLFHKIEGQRDVYWTGPSVGFDVGGNASKTFVLVYNLYDTQDIYKRYPAGEGAAYLVGGFTASYLRRGDVVLIPIRLGVGYRLGANVGYMKFTEKQKWLPF